MFSVQNKPGVPLLLKLVGQGSIAGLNRTNVLSL